MPLLKLEKKSAFGDDKKYSRNIQIPQYEPKNAKPPIYALYDDTKKNKICQNIRYAKNTGKINDAEYMFLMSAAQRHTVYRYDKIADYYAHASKTMQELMEESALVIVDADDAIMNGYVEATDRMTEIIEGAKKPHEK